MIFPHFCCCYHFPLFKLYLLHSCPLLCRLSQLPHLINSFYDVFYEVFLFIHFLVCLLQFYFCSNLIISSCVFLVNFIYVVPGIYSTPLFIYDQYIIIFIFYLMFFFQVHISHSWLVPHSKSGHSLLSHVDSALEPTLRLFSLILW